MSNGEIDLADVIANGGAVDPDLLYRSLPYLVDPAWTRRPPLPPAVRDRRPVVGHRGPRRRADPRLRPGRRPRRRTRSSRCRPRPSASSSAASSRRPTRCGCSSPRSRARSTRSRCSAAGSTAPRAATTPSSRARRSSARCRQSRAGSWGSTVNGAAASPGQGDPAHESEGKRRAGGDLLSYGQLYALWEKQNWKAHELDFTVDKEQWLTTPAESQAHTAWSLGSFYIGEERVTADLAPFLLAAPSGEVEMFLATQLVDEAAPYRVLRPLRRRGDGALGRRPARPDARARGHDDPGLARDLRRRPARHRQPAQERTPTTSTSSSRASAPTT